ncbi:ABC transporter permease [Gracilibacillus marinus]|jgi:putative spermidine/putrescine transport system permease protein|uniref:ABC transporter permease n=1 Tax=Gracilibacillus marinus TaxID=630535 RepID=A0ABV8VTT6_9BACI
MKSTSLRESIFTRLAGIGIATPALLTVSLLFVYPFILSFAESFQLKDGGIGLANYIEAFTTYGGDMVYTIIICVISLSLLLLITVFIAGILRLYAFPVVEFLFKIPLFVPYVVVGHAMRVFLAPNGTLNAAIDAMTLWDVSQLPSIAYSSAGLIAALVWKNLGIALLILLGAFRSVNEEMLEAAQGLGANKLKVITQFLIPLSKGSFGVIAILTFTSMISSFSIPAMIGSGGGNHMIMIDLYHQIVYQQNPGLANALGVFSYIISLGAAIYYIRGLSKK